ncbi:MAG TPA: PEP-CTERM sorting domain-containing protein [Opitutales bacterium]|nr:PEP-CTERM sorting domain-containing protein [Opitutales bacterium]
MKRIQKIGYLCFSVAAFSLTSHASIVLQHWDFTSADAGLNPTQVVGNIAGGPQFTVGGDGQLTTGSTLRISPTTALNAHVDVASISLPSGYDKFRLEYTIGGWDWSIGAATGETRRLSMGWSGTFTDGQPTPNSFLFAAGGSIRMNASGEIRFTAEGGLNVNINGEDTLTNLNAVQNSPIFLRVDVDPWAREFTTTFSDSSDFSNVLFSFTGGSGLSRSPDGRMNNFRIGPLDGDPSGVWNGDFAMIDSLTYSVIPEPSTYAAIFGGLALAGAFIYRRRMGAEK